MKTEIIKVTPDMASEWLKGNTINRPLRRTVVDGLKNAFIRGEYMMTHQGVAFSSDGTLLDGQHRLTAISELRDGAFPMLVTTGLSEEAFQNIDIGVKRTAADALRTEDRRLVEAARLIAGICVSNKSSITPTMLVPIMRNIEKPHNALLAFCPTVSRVWSSAPVRLAGVMAIKSGQDVEYVRSVYHALVTSRFNAMPPVAHSIYKAQVDGRIRSTDKLDMLARCLIVFDQSKSQAARVQVKDSSTASRAVRQIFGWLVESDEVRAAKKKAVPFGAAKDVLPANYVMDGA